MGEIHNHIAKGLLKSYVKVSHQIFVLTSHIKMAAHNQEY